MRKLLLGAKRKLEEAEIYDGAVELPNEAEFD